MNDISRENAGELIRGPIKHGDIVQEEHDDQLLFRLSASAFGKIILDFLGSKQNLTVTIEDPFIMGIEDICQFHYLLISKIEKEQFTTVNLFSVTIHYDDNSKRTFNTVENLESMIETRNVIATDVSLSWKIVLKFPNSVSIENQNIDITFGLYSENHKNGYIILNIEHTNQSWGIEVLQLFRSQINKTTSKLSSFKKTFMSVTNDIYSGYSIPNLLFVGFIIAVITFLFFFVISITARKSEEDAQFNTHRKIIEILKSKEDIDQSMYYQSQIAFEIIRRSHYPRFFSDFEELIFLDSDIKDVISDHIDKIDKINKISKFNRIFLFPLSVYFIIIILYFYVKKVRIIYEEKSFLLLTSEDKNKHDRYERIRSKNQLYSIGSITIAIIIGIIANVIFNAPWKLWFY